MKQKINIRQRLALKLGTTLEYVIAGTAIVGVLTGILFTFNFLSNNKDAAANIESANTIMLMPEDRTGNTSREATPHLSISNTSDSLYIQISSDEEEPLHNAILRLKDMEGHQKTESNSQTRVMTLFSPTQLNRTTYRFAIPIKGFPESLRVEVKASLSRKNASEEITKAWSTKFDYSLKAAQVAMLHSGTRATKRK